MPYKTVETWENGEYVFKVEHTCDTLETASADIGWQDAIDGFSYDASRFFAPKWIDGNAWEIGYNNGCESYDAMIKDW